MNYEQAKALKDEIAAASNLAGARFTSLCDQHKGAMGLTSDSFKATDEYKTAKAEFEIAFARARAINVWFMKHFKKQYQAERAARFAA